LVFFWKIYIEKILEDFKVSSFSGPGENFGNLPWAIFNIAQTRRTPVIAASEFRGSFLPFCMGRIL
jgi:hypothetical protein